MYVVRDLSKNAQHGVLLGVARVWDMRDIVSTFRKMSTKPDQAQVEFVVSEHVQGLALVVVVRTGQPDQRGLSRNARGNDFLDEPTPRAHLN